MSAGGGESSTMRIYQEGEQKQKRATRQGPSMSCPTTPWPLALHKNTQEVTTLPGHTGNLAALCKTFETSEKQEVE